MCRKVEDILKLAKISTIGKVTPYTMGDLNLAAAYGWSRSLGDAIAFSLCD